MASDNEKLISLLKKMDSDPTITCPRKVSEPCTGCEFNTNDDKCDTYARKAAYLIENGVVVPPVKLGSKQKVYIPIKNSNVILITKVYGIGVDDEGDFVINPKEYHEKVISINGYNLGETVFLTKSEAEQKLKEMRGE